MTTERPFLEWPLDQLADYARMHAGHGAALARVRHELSHRPGRAARQLERQIADAAASPHGVEQGDLKHQLSLARREITALRARLALHEPAGAPGLAPDLDRLLDYARLGLTPEAPRWLVIEVRKAYRRRHHPDRFIGDERRAAERQFQALEKLFSGLILS